MKHECLIVYAFRYALGRCTYVVSDVAKHIYDHWDEISPKYQELITKEIQEALEKGKAGQKCDEDAWKDLLHRVED